MNPNNESERILLKLGAVSGILLAVGYVVIIGVYSAGGALPTGGENWLKYMSERVNLWWMIIWLSVLTDLLFLPLAVAIYINFKNRYRLVAFVGSSLLVMFVLLDLAITWPNYSALMSLSSGYSAATSSLDKLSYIAGANYATAVLTSPVLTSFIILLPGLGIMILGWIMHKTKFSNAAAFSGIITGIFAIISFIGPFFSKSLALAAVIASTFTLLWCLFAGIRLWRSVNNLKLEIS